MAARNTDKSTMSSKKTFNPAEIDDLGFFSTIKMGVVTPVKTSLKLGVTGLIIADSTAQAVYENREDLAKVAKQTIKQTSNLLKVGVLGIAKLNNELGEAMGVDINEDIDVLIDGIYKEETK